MTCPQITQSLKIKDNYMRIMLDKYLGLYCWGETQPSILLLKVLSMIWTQKQKYYPENLFRTLLKSTITC